MIIKKIYNSITYKLIVYTFLLKAHEVQVGKDIKKNHLKKVELLLDNHKCSIEGRLNSEQLIKLVELLEEA